MNWIQALKHWNDKKGGKYTIPKKGSKEHAQVMKLMKGKGLLTKGFPVNKPISKPKVTTVKGGALNREYAIKTGTKLLQKKGVQSPTEEQAIAEAERDMDEKFKKATQRGLEKAKTKPKRKYVKRVGRKLVGGSLKSKSSVVIGGIQQKTEKAERMKGGMLSGMLYKSGFDPYNHDTWGDAEAWLEDNGATQEDMKELYNAIADRLQTDYTQQDWKNMGMHSNVYDVEKLIKQPITPDSMDKEDAGDHSWKGGSLTSEKLLGGSMRKTKELQVIAGLPQIASVRGGSIKGRFGASDPRLYGLSMFGQ